MRKASQTEMGTTESMVFATYLEARQASKRRSARDAENGMISMVEQSPYGGYVVRSWPLDMLADLDVGPIIRNRRGSYVASLEG